MTNVLITKDWRVWLIDFTRAFRPDEIPSGTQEPLTRVDRKLLANLRGLTLEGLRQTARAMGEQARRSKPSSHGAISW